MVPKAFTLPKRVLMAFDGSKTARKGVEMLAKSPLFDDASCHVVIVGAETAENHSQLQWAMDTLQAAGHQTEALFAPVRWKRRCALISKKRTLTCS